MPRHGLLRVVGQINLPSRVTAIRSATYVSYLFLKIASHILYKRIAIYEPKRSYYGRGGQYCRRL